MISIGEQQQQAAQPSSSTMQSKPTTTAAATSFTASKSSAVSSVDADWDASSISVRLLAEVGISREAVVVLDNLVSSRQRDALLRVLRGDCESSDGGGGPPAARWDK